MKTKVLTLFLVFLTSIGSAFADTAVTINDLKYLLNEETKTAKVTFKYSSTKYGDTYYNIQFYSVYDEYFNSFIDKPISWTIDTVNIPPVIIYNEETYDVIGIGEHAFERCDSLRSVTIPSSITNIESNAFASCYNLTAVHITDIAAWCGINFIGQNPLSIAHNLYLNGDLVSNLIIPNEVISIRGSAFTGCSSLTSVTISDNVTDINERAFYNCDNLCTVSIGKNVISIADDAFSGSTHLRSVILHSDSLVSRDYPCSYPRADCGMNAIFGDNVMEYFIGDEVKRIGRYAFNTCKNLTTISISDGVASIGDEAFRECSNLTSITIPNSVKSIGVGAFMDCRKLFSIVIPNSVDSIGMSAFLRCYDLDSISIPNNVKYLGKKAFYNCRNLKYVIIGDGITNIEDETFFGCTQLSCVVIGENVNQISYCSFAGGNSLQTITFPNSVVSIGERAFTGSNFRSLIIPGNIKSIGEYAFSGNHRLKSIVIQEGVEIIGRGVLAESNSLDSVIFPNSVKNIGNKALFLCEKLKYIKLPDSITSIGDSCFIRCISLPSIDIPNSVTSIGVRAFEFCHELNSVTIPKNVTNIGCEAFDHYTEEIMLLPETPPAIISQTPSRYCLSSTSSIFVPCGTLEAYMASDWSAYNIQYHPNIYALNISSSDTLKGLVDSEGNVCTTTLSATPKEGNYFVKWSDGNTNNPRTITLTQDTTITAIFAAQKFIVKFVDDNDTILSSLEYEYGAIPVLPEDPVKTNDAQYTYTFAGWLPQIVAVTSDATYKATYTSTLNKYTITFVSEGSVLSADLWEYGTTPVYRGTTPTKIEDEQYTYTFSNWTPEIVSVVEDATYTATFTATEKTEAIDNILDKSKVPVKIVDNGNIYILMPNGKKYSIIGELVE